MSTNKRCPQCQGWMRIAQDEFCGYCDHCLIVKYMPRMAFNSLKAEAMKFRVTEEEFAANYVVPSVATRAYRSAYRGGGGGGDGASRVKRIPKSEHRASPEPPPQAVPGSLDERDERGFGCYMDGKWLVDVLLPGFIEAHSGCQFGNPTLVDSRMPAFAWWPFFEFQDRPQDFPSEDLPYTREQIIALAASQAGVEWQRSRKRRKRIDEAVTAGWKGSEEG